MSKEICISTTPHETRLAILEDDELAEIYYERENEYTLAGSIYKGRVTRVLPGMQSAFVDIGLERDAFLYVTDFLEEQEDSDEFERTALPGGQRREPRENGRGRQPQPAEQAAAPAADGEAQGAEEGESPAGTRRWRGRRGRGRGAKPRGREGEREGGERQDGQNQVQSQPVEAGSEDVRYDAPAPSANFSADTRLYESEAAFEPQAPARGGERTLLPGESLSRYGGKSEAPAEKAQTASAPGFKTNYTAPKPSTLVDVPLTWDGASLLPGESRAMTGKSEPAPVHAESHAASSVAEAETELATEEQEQQGTWAAESEPVATSEPAVEEQVHEQLSSTPPLGAESAFKDRAPRPEPEPTQEEDLNEDVQEEVQEFEPENASASHRVETAAPSEFRVPSVAEPEEEFDEQASTREEDAAGEEPEHDEQATEVADQLFGFAPGTGILEEEVIDEDEYDFEPIHAEGDEDLPHESEDLEEETLERSTQLTDAVREEHIAARLAVEPSTAEAEEAEADEGGEFVEEISEEETDEEEENGSGENAPATPSRERGTGGAERRGRRGGERRSGGARLGRRQGRGGHRASAQTMDLPIISDLLKQGQEILLQIAKEPIAKKGARVTSHIALPGRFLVFMPTVNHVGVSRKISSDEERLRLKRILISEKGDASGGFIVRTAADGASEEELRADLRFLISLWNDIKQREEGSKAPALIYHDLNLVERVLRDQVSDNFSTIWVDSEAEYERIVRFLNRFQPALVRRVKLYTKQTPLFEQFGIQDEITKALKSKVWLKSGGSIVINQTEALVAIDINTGKYVGKTARLEDTILKTNLDAIPEIVRQIRLRDLGGIIVIDFIDM
ncbi:MAG: Rne/Rng family ribonuclease, partial [Acidobacteriaceae bacterium]